MTSIPEPPAQSTSTEPSAISSSNVAPAATEQNTNTASNTASNTPPTQTATPSPSPWKKRIKIAALALVATGGVVGVACMIHPPLIGTIVDGVRAVVGPKPIAWLEDQVYGAKDAYDRWKYKDAAPTTYWTPAPGCDSSSPATSACGEAPVVPTPATSGGPPTDTGPFPPKAVTPPFPKVAAAGDGQWVAVPDPQDPSAPPAMYKMVMHPDGKRSYSIVAIVAVDLKRIEMFSVPGFGEPKSEILPRSKRPGLVPAEHFPNLLAAFNGGFQLQHGYYGMMVDGVTLAKAQGKGCVVAKFKDGTMKVAEWKQIEPQAAEAAFWRQTPPCLVEGGTINPTVNEANRNWGATVDGETIIRRSAFGLDSTGTVAFYAMGDAQSSLSLAKAMQLAGASDVAQLDVNHIYPRFFFYDGAKEGPPMITAPLAPVPMFKKDEYTVAGEYRDFFFLARKKQQPKENQ